MILDLHVHTYKSPLCGWMKPKQLVKQAMKKGLDGLAVTDHNTIDGAIEIIDTVRGEQNDFIVIIGEEITTDRGEILAYFVDKEIIPGPFTDVLKEIKDAGGISVIPHPFDNLRHNSVSLTDEDVGSFDCIEVFNSRSLFKTANDLAYLFTKKYDLAITAGSDAHFLNEVGNGGVLIQQQNIRQAILEKKLTVFGHKSIVINHALTKALKFGRTAQTFIP